MKSIIAIMRLIGIIAFIAFIVLRITDNTNAANVIMFLSLGCFVIVILLQLYRFYIKNYWSKEE